MPTYEYKCTKCGHEFEAFQSITESPLAECLKCKGKPERMISGGAGFLFKGTGFYETDYRSSEYKKKAEKEKKAESPSTSTEKKESKTDSSKKADSAATTSSATSKSD